MSNVPSTNGKRWVDADAHEKHLLKMIARQERVNERSDDLGSSASSGGQLCALRAELNYVRTHAVHAPSASPLREELEAFRDDVLHDPHMDNDTINYVLGVFDHYLSNIDAERLRLAAESREGGGACG